MAIKAAIVLVAVSVALLTVYGADVAVSYSNEQKEGFLPFDHKMRGMGLGMPALILPFISFIIARNEPSKLHGTLLILSSALIVAGGIVVLLSTPEPESARDPVTEAGPLIIAGIVIAVLGAIKLKRS